MKKIIFLLFIIGIYSCQKQESKAEDITDKNLSQQQIDSILTDFKFEYENPVFIDGTDEILLPISTRVENTRTYSTDDIYSNENTRYWNILFYNVLTGETNLLSESKLRISDFSANIEKAGNIIEKSILYKISINDYNHDNKLDQNDPEQLFISSNFGTGLKRLTPLNENLESYTIIPQSNQILVKTRRDINNDLAFNTDDELIWYKIDLNTDTNPVEIIDSLKRRKIENLYFEQWIRKK